MFRHCKKRKGIRFCAKADMFHSTQALIAQLDKKTGEVTKKKPSHVTSGALLRCIIECAQPVCLELFSEIPQLGRFTLRDEGKTVAIGKVTALGPKKAAQQQQKAV
jgi:peptide chain release factor subunit 3